MKNWCGYDKQELKIIRDFIHSINSEIQVRISTGKDWCCRPEWYRLYLGAKKQEQWVEDIRQKWCEEQEFYNKELNGNLLSLLHEIGHFQTINVDEWLERHKLARKYQNMYCEDKIKTMEELNYLYFNIPSEYKATKWAFEYYKANKEKCDNLAKILRV